MNPANTAIAGSLALLAGLAAFAAAAQEVIPDFYKEPGIYPNRSYINQGFGEFIDPFTGALQLHYVDLNLPGNGGFDLQVVRSYNSASVEPTNPARHESLSGVGWNIHFGRVLKTQETSICFNKNSQTVADNPVLELPDGSRQLLAFTGSTAPLLMTTRRWRADCIAGGAGGLAVGGCGVGASAKPAEALLSLAPPLSPATPLTATLASSGSELGRALDASSSAAAPWWWGTAASSCGGAEALPPPPPPPLPMAASPERRDGDRAIDGTFPCSHTQDAIRKS
jgi:hypothetical protein